MRRFLFHKTHTLHHTIASPSVTYRVVLVNPTPHNVLRHRKLTLIANTTVPAHSCVKSHVGAISKNSVASGIVAQCAGSCVPAFSERMRKQSRGDTSEDVVARLSRSLWNVRNWPARTVAQYMNVPRYMATMTARSIIATRLNPLFLGTMRG